MERARNARRAAITRRAGAAVVALVVVGLAACTPPPAPTPGQLTMSPGGEGFGFVAIGSSRPPSTFTVVNGTAHPTGIVDVAIVGANKGDFLLSADGCSGTTLAVGASCSVLVTFAPTAEGVRSAVVVATAAPGGTVTSTLDGEGTATPANLTISPLSQPYGTVSIGSSASSSFTVTNTGSTTSGTLKVLVSGGSDGTTDFSIESDDCSSVALAGSGPCHVRVRFAPTSLGAKSGTLTVSATPGGSATASLSGTGADPASVTITPDSQDFGAVAVGSARSSLFTVTNGGGMPTGALTAEVESEGFTDFSIESDDCTGAALDAAGPCHVRVRFAPTSRGAQAALLTVSATPGGSATASLSGTGADPASLTITPAVQDFGQVAVGSASAVTLTVRNNGGVATSALTVELSSGGTKDFSIQNDGCTGVTLDSLASCVVDVSFQPTSVSAKTATVSVMASPGGTATASVSGRGA